MFGSKRKKNKNVLFSDILVDVFDFPRQFYFKFSQKFRDFKMKLCFVLFIIFASRIDFGSFQVIFPTAKTTLAPSTQPASSTVTPTGASKIENFKIVNFSEYFSDYESDFNDFKLFCLFTQKFHLRHKLQLASFLTCNLNVEGFLITFIGCGFLFL